MRICISVCVDGGGELWRSGPSTDGQSTDTWLGHCPSSVLCSLYVCMCVYTCVDGGGELWRSGSSTDGQSTDTGLGHCPSAVLCRETNHHF